MQVIAEYSGELHGLDQSSGVAEVKRDWAVQGQINQRANQDAGDSGEDGADEARAQDARE